MSNMISNNRVMLIGEIMNDFKFYQSKKDPEKKTAFGLLKVPRLYPTDSYDCIPFTVFNTSEKELSEYTPNSNVVLEGYIKSFKDRKGFDKIAVNVSLLHRLRTESESNDGDKSDYYDLCEEDLPF